MNFSPERQRYWLEQGALHYVLVCLIALAVIYLDLGQRGLAGWAAFPVGVGLAGLLTRWAAGPGLVVVTVALAFTVAENLSASVSLGSSLLIPDLVLAAGVLAYVMAHNRFTLINRAFATQAPRRTKPFWRRSRAVAAPAPPTTRPPPSRRLVSPQEVGRLILAVPLWAIAAECCWLLLPGDWGNPGVRPAQYWRVLLLAWLILGPLLIVAAVIRYLRLRRQTPAEAALALQDVLWRETRWEQRRINRWFAWAHVRSMKPARKFRLRPGWIILILTTTLLAVVLILRGTVGR